MIDAPVPKAARHRIVPASGRLTNMSAAQLAVLLPLAAIVLHVLVDAFVTTEPGVGGGEHVLAAAVPVASAAIAALLWPSLRAGTRGAATIVFGVLALVGGGIAVAHAASEGPAGDDWTGFLLLPAGVTLLALGARELWISRKPGGRRILRRTLIGLAAALLAYEVVLPVGFAIVATHKPRASVVPVDLGRPFEEVSLRTADGLELAGWYVPSRNGAAVIAFPGRSGPVPHARMLARNGYGVLLVDLRGTGESEGDPNGFGWGSVADLDAAVAFLQGRPDVEAGRIGGLGLSVGGELMLEAAAENPGLAAVVSEGAGLRSGRETFAREGVSRLQVALQWPNEAILTAATALLSGDAPPPSLEKSAAGISPRPVFLLYGEEGQGSERALTPAYFAAAGEPKTLWEIPGAGHTGGLDARPLEYEQRVVGFFDEHLLR